MIFKSEWEGSENPEVSSGVATFKVNRFSYSFKLDNFDDFLKIETMLDNAFSVGKRSARKAIEEKIMTAIYHE